jgi:hypothetical protein
MYLQQHFDFGITAKKKKKVDGLTNFSNLLFTEFVPSIKRFLKGGGGGGGQLVCG